MNDIMSAPGVIALIVVFLLFVALIVYKSSKSKKPGNYRPGGKDREGGNGPGSDR